MICAEIPHIDRIRQRASRELLQAPDSLGDMPYALKLLCCPLFTFGKELPKT